MKVHFRRLGDALSRLIDRATLYRLTDDALIVSSAIVGGVAGLAIVLFHLVLEIVDRGFQALSPGIFHTTNLTVLLIPLITGLGGLCVGVLKSVFFRDIDHHGLHTVAASLSERSTPLTWRHAFHAIILSSISIASGGGAGRESPTVVLGASVASGLARLGAMDRRHVRILSAAGAAAAISGIFNAPLGGILFAVEAITGELRARTFVPIVISSVLATATVRTVLGNDPLLRSPNVVSVPLAEYPLLAIAGLLSAVIAVYYLRTYDWSFRRTRNVLSSLPTWLRPCLGGIVAGIPLMAVPALLETTYTPVNNAIAGNGILWMAALTVLLKPLTNAVTLGSGGEGGTFAPAMKAGALFGFCLGTSLHFIFPDINAGLYALVCAGAVVAGTFRAPLAGAIILFEVSGNYGMLLPLLFSSVFTVYVVRRMTTLTFNPLPNDLPEQRRDPDPRA